MKNDKNFYLSMPLTKLHIEKIKIFRIFLVSSIINILKNKNKMKKIFWSVLFMSGVFPLGVSAAVSNIAIDPALDISRFAPYTVKADISESPASASLEISGINGQNPGGAWDYYADGTVASQPKTKTMTYNEGSAK